MSLIMLLANVAKGGMSCACISATAAWRLSSVRQACTVIAYPCHGQGMHAQQHRLSRSNSLSTEKLTSHVDFSICPSGETTMHPITPCTQTLRCCRRRRGSVMHTAKIRILNLIFPKLERYLVVADPADSCIHILSGLHKDQFFSK